MKANSIKLPQEVVYDCGGRGEKEICGVKISTPGKPKRHLMRNDVNGRSSDEERQWNQ